jgi:hypothetical protein
MTNTLAKIEQPQSGALALPNTSKEFLLAHTVPLCLRKLRTVNTPALAIKSEMPTLGALKKAYSEDFMLAYIELWLVNLNDFINVSRKMKPEQMQELSFMIYQDFYYFNLADINLVFSKIKKGEFGQLFESVDGVKILSYFKKYEGERMSVAYDEGLQEHELSKPKTDERRNKAIQVKQALKKARGYEAHLKTNTETANFQKDHKAEK